VKYSLTDMGVQKLAPGTYFDTKTPAFGIRVGKHRRTWLIYKGKSRRVVTLGHYPELTLQEARKRAYTALGATEAVKATITFPEAVTAFLDQDRWRPGSKRVLTSNLRKFSWQGQLARITHEQVIEALDWIERSSARAHALKDIRTFFNWCVPRYLATSPAVGIKMDKQPSRDRVLTDDELKAVWVAADDCGQFGVIVKLLMLTGQRRTEISSLQWDWVKSDRITLPATLTKNGREHCFPVAAMVAELVKSPAVTGRDLLFPVRSTAAGPRAPSGWSSGLRMLHKLSGTSGWTLHDLRRTFATGLAKLGTPIHVTEKILNHVSGSLSGMALIYNRHDYWAEQVAAMKAWEERLLAIVT